jgi:hypothetical protein
MNGVETNWRGLLEDASLPDAAAKEQRLEMVLLDEAASDHTKATVLQQFAAQSFRRGES